MTQWPDIGSLALVDDMGADGSDRGPNAAAAVGWPGFEMLEAPGMPDAAEAGGIAGTAIASGAQWRGSLAGRRGANDAQAFVGGLCY